MCLCHFWVLSWFWWNLLLWITQLSWIFDENWTERFYFIKEKYTALFLSIYNSNSFCFSICKLHSSGIHKKISIWNIDNKICFSFRRSIHQSASSHVCKMVQYSSTILEAFYASVMAICWMLVAFSKLPKAMFWIVVVSCTNWVPPLTLKVNTFLSFSLDKEPV